MNYFRNYFLISYISPAFDKKMFSTYNKRAETELSNAQSFAFREPLVGAKRRQAAREYPPEHGAEPLIEVLEVSPRRYAGYSV